MSLGQNGTMLGVSVNYQLIELFNIMNNVKSIDEYNTLKEDFLKSQDFTFPGIKESSYEEVVNIYNNIVKYCNIITPEAEGKMGVTVKNNVPLFKDGSINKDVFDFTYLDKIVLFAKQNKLKVRLHTLIWHKYFPKILNDCSKEQVTRFLDSYFSCIASRYGNDFFPCIDVLNEIASENFEDEEILRESKWKEKLGDDYYLTVLVLARKYFPKALLVYNEYDELNKYKRECIIKIVNKIKEKEKKSGLLLLNCLGLQSHYHEFVKVQEIEEAFWDLSLTNKDLQITESDIVKVSDNNSDKIFNTILECSLKYKVKYFSFWGPTSKVSWKSLRVRTFLDDKGNVDVVCRKIVEAFSFKENVRSS